MFSLNDDSIGVVFNDLTKLLLLADSHNIHYIDYESRSFNRTNLCLDSIGSGFDLDDLFTVMRPSIIFILK